MDNEPAAKTKRGRPISRREAREIALNTLANIERARKESLAAEAGSNGPAPVPFEWIIAALRFVNREASLVELIYTPDEKTLVTINNVAPDELDARIEATRKLLSD